MKNKNIYVSILCILVAAGIGFYLMHRTVTAPAGESNQAQMPPSDQSFTLSCDAAKSMSLTVHLPEDKSVDIALSDGRKLSLANVSTADGIAYTNADGSIKLLVLGAAASLVEAGNPTYSNCAIDQSALDAAGANQ